MGNKSTFNPYQRMQDANQEAPMRPPKRLYTDTRILYHPELLTCPHCGELLVMWNYLAWDKIVQTLDRVLSIATRPGRCPNPTCPGFHRRLLSGQAQQVALPGSTYGYDVVVRIGWLRQYPRATYREIHADLASPLSISVSHVPYLYQHFYLPLLACHERQPHERLAQIVKQHGGLILSLDGLAPQGGEPPIWVIRDLLSGVTLRSGWLSQQDQCTFEAFLKPLQHLEWPILAVLSDKQKGLVPAVATLFPNHPPQFCQAHDLRNLAEPLAETDSAFKVDLRQAVRHQVGDLIRQEPQPISDRGGVLTVTGLLPSPLEVPLSSCAPPPSAPLATPLSKADTVVTSLLRHTRYLLTLKGRPPFRLAGLETVERLGHVTRLGVDLLAVRYEPRLAQLVPSLQAALSPFAQTVEGLQQGAAWLRGIAYLLEPPSRSRSGGDHVAEQLRDYLDIVCRWPHLTPTLKAFGRHLAKVSRSYWPGLFHCYNVPGLARTNHDLESRFRDTTRRLLRTTGQKGLTLRMLQRQGAWELLPGLPSEAQVLDAVCQTSPEALAQERQRFAENRRRFCLQSRSLRRTQTQFNRLRQMWSALQPTGAGGL